MVLKELILVMILIANSFAVHEWITKGDCDALWSKLPVGAANHKTALDMIAQNNNLNVDALYKLYSDCFRSSEADRIKRLHNIMDEEGMRYKKDTDFDDNMQKKQVTVMDGEGFRYKKRERDFLRGLAVRKRSVM